MNGVAGGAAAEWDGALTLADLGIRDHHRLEDARRIVRHLLVVKPIRTFLQVAETEDATTTVVVLQPGPCRPRHQGHDLRTAFGVTIDLYPDHSHHLPLNRPLDSVEDAHDQGAGAEVGVRVGQEHLLTNR